MFNLTLTTPVSLLISLAALAGVALHDTKIDKLATTFAGIPALISTTDSGNKGMFNDPHTHVERISINDMNSSQPRLMPRAEQKRYMLQKNVPRGAHRFDTYTLPLA